MKINRTLQTKKNILAAVIDRGIVLLMGFLARTAVIRFLGSEYVGLSGLVTSILNILNLAELGLGSAIVFNMYKPIAEDDSELICALLRFYRRAYAIIGSVILIVGLGLMPFLNNLIKGDIPEGINIYIIYLVYLFNTCIGYFIFGYIRVVLPSHQRNDIDTYINSITFIIEYGVQIIILWLSKNYYAYVLVTPIVTLLMNIIRFFVTRRMFPQYSCYGNLSKETKASVYENIKGLLIQKICSATRNTFDSVFISAYIGLLASGIYSNYYYILSTVHVILITLKSAMSAGIGNSIAAETQEKNYKDMEMFTFIYQWVAGLCTACMLCVYQPFMEIWAGPDSMLPMSNVILFCLYFYLETIGDIRFSYSSGAGLWWNDRFRSLFEMIANIVLNALLGKVLGIAGIILATILTIFFINFVYGSRVLFKYYFTEYSVKEYYLQQFTYMGMTFIAAGITYFICHLFLLVGWGKILISLLICLVIPNCLFVLIYRRTEIFTRSYLFFKNRVLNINRYRG